MGKTALLDYVAGRASAGMPGGARQRVCSRRWSWPSPGCISCARRCSIAWSACRCRSVRRWGPRLASARVRRRTGSWSAWRCWACCRRWQGSGRWCAWWMTSSGLTGPRRRPWGSWRGGWRRSRWAWFSRRGCRAGSWRGCRSWRVAGLAEGDAGALLDSVLAGPLDVRVRDQIVAETRGNPLALLELPRGLTPAELAGGFGLPGARPLSGRIEESFRRQPEALPAADAAAAAAGGGRSVRRPAAGVAGGRAARDPVPARRARGGGGPGRSSAHGCGSGIRWSARRRTGRRRCRSDKRCTARWRRSPIRRSIPTAAPGTAPRPRRARMRISPRSWSARRAGRRPAGAWPRRPRSWNARRC